LWTFSDLRKTSANWRATNPTLKKRGNKNKTKMEIEKKQQSDMFKRLSMVTCMLLNMKLKIETKTSEDDLLITKWDLRSSPPLI
jgi:hypothetical protein